MESIELTKQQFKDMTKSELVSYCQYLILNQYPVIWKLSK